MGRGSLSDEAHEDFENAEAMRRRRDPDGGHQFASVRHALGFMVERGDAMQGALGRHPRGALGKDGQTHVVSVDGGRGGTLDDLLATLQSIANACADLRAADPDAFHVLMLNVGADPEPGVKRGPVAEADAAEPRKFRRGPDSANGMTYAEIARHVGMSQSSVSALIGKAEAFLLGRLMGDVIGVPRTSAPQARIARTSRP